MKVFGILMLLGIGAYLVVWQLEARGVREFCSRFPVGADASEIWTVADGLWGDLTGSRQPVDLGGKKTFIYCAPTTMCDVSCSLEVVDGVVTESDYRSL